MESLEKIALFIYEAIFSNKDEVEIEGQIYPIYATRTGLRNVKYSGIWFIEQNPQKRSHHAQMAQKGHHILWGLKGRTYVLRVIDGKFTLLKKV